MCSPLDPLGCLTGLAGDGMAAAASTTLDTMLTGINQGLQAGIKAMTTVLARWLLVPSTKLCPGVDQPGTAWMATCDASPAAQLRAWTLPITILVATLGLLWQAVMLTITRKGEPLLQALRGPGHRRPVERRRDRRHPARPARQRRLHGLDPQTGHLRGLGQPDRHAGHRAGQPRTGRVL
jgi:hypothetical protein